MDQEHQKLQNAAAALKAGDRTTARDILIQVLRENPNQDDAWVGLSLCATSDGQRKECLQRALRINPGNRYASTRLARLETAMPPAPARPMITEQPANTPEAPPKPVKNTKAQQKWTEVYIGLALVAVLIVGGFAALVFVLQGQTRQTQTIQTSQTNDNPPAASSTEYKFIDFYADW